MCFWMLSSWMFFWIIIINNFQGDLPDISAKKAWLRVIPHQHMPTDDLPWSRHHWIEGSQGSAPVILNSKFKKLIFGFFYPINLIIVNKKYYIRGDLTNVSATKTQIDQHFDVHTPASE